MARERTTFLCILIAFLLLSSSVIGVLTSGESTNDLEDDVGPEPTVDHKYVSSSYNGSYPFSNEYPSLSQLYSWYDDLEANHSSICKKIKIGESYEGRNLTVLKVSDNVSQDEDEPAVLIDGNIHAREWSTHQAASYLLWRLTTEYDTNETIHWLVNNREIFIMPMLNPDGYYYDGNGNLSEKEYWRKNRNSSTPTSAVGVDLNRNWDSQWEKGDDEPSNQTYHGERPFSENETSCLKEFILEQGIDSYQNIHSHLGSLLLPSYDSAHSEWFQGMADHMTQLTSRMGHGDRHYTYGRPEKEVGYKAYGAADNWVYGEIRAQSFSFELFTGKWENISHGFYPLEEDIMTINQDVDESLIYQARVADAELGDEVYIKQPPVPYLVFGSLEDKDGEPVQGVNVTVENQRTDEEISIKTDSNGYYEVNLALLVDEGYKEGDTISVETDPGTTRELFEIGENWGHRLDLQYSEAAQVNTGWFNVFTDNSIEFSGNVTLGKTDSVEGYFQYRVQGNETWEESGRRQIDGDQVYSITLEDLVFGRAYEFRAAIEWMSGEENDYGRIKTFNTTHELTLSSTVGGEVISPGEDIFEYDYGSEVELEASVSGDHRFIQWIGDTEGIKDVQAKKTTVEMLDDYEIRAYFQIGDGSQEDPYLIESVHHL